MNIALLWPAGCYTRPPIDPVYRWSAMSYCAGHRTDWRTLDAPEIERLPPVVWNRSGPGGREQTTGAELNRWHSRGKEFLSAPASAATYPAASYHSASVWRLVVTVIIYVGGNHLSTIIFNRCANVTQHRVQCRPRNGQSDRQCAGKTDAGRLTSGAARGNVHCLPWEWAGTGFGHAREV